MESGSSAGPDAAFRRPRGRKAEFWARHNGGREAAIRARQEYDEERQAGAQKLLGTHYHRRRDKLARGFVEERRKMPRAWQHALAARDPETHRSFLPARAILLLDELRKWAPPALPGKATKAFGLTQGAAAARLGLSMKRTRRGPNGDRVGEPHGARRVRSYLDMLETLNIITRQGRHWYRKGDKWKRLVVIIRPFEEWLIFRYAEALAPQPETPTNPGTRPPLELVTADRENASTIRISRSGCITDLLDDPNLCASSGASGAVAQLQRQPADGPAQQPLGVSDSPRASEGASRPAFEGGNGSAVREPIPDPAKLVELSGTSIMRKFRGPVLEAVIVHYVQAGLCAIDAADGQAGPASKGGAKTPQIANQAQPDAIAEEPAPATAGDEYSFANVSRRFHGAEPCPGGSSGCDSCLKMARAVAISRANAAAAAAPPKYVPPRAEQNPLEDAPDRRPYRQVVFPLEEAPPAPPANRPAALPLDGLLERAAAIAADSKPSNPAELLQAELEAALSRPVIWRRTRCRAPAPYTCKPYFRTPCRKCLDIDEPFKAEVGRERWKLRFDRGKPFMLVIDCRDVGPVASWPAAWRSTGEKLDESSPKAAGDRDEDSDAEE